MVEAAPAAALEVPQPEFLLQLLEVALDAPAQPRRGDQLLVRLGRAGRGRQVLLEDLPGCPVAEAAARGVVEPVGQPPQADARERFGLAVAGEETPDPPVRVLDGAFRMLA